MAALEKRARRSYLQSGHRRGTSVLELVRAFEEANGLKIPCRIAERRPGDIAECYADVTKAREELGWEAKRGVFEMCRDAWRFEQSYEAGE